MTNARTAIRNTVLGLLPALGVLFCGGSPLHAQLGQRGLLHRGRELHAREASAEQLSAWRSTVWTEVLGSDTSLMAVPPDEAVELAYLAAGGLSNVQRQGLEDRLKRYFDEDMSRLHALSASSLDHKLMGIVEDPTFDRARGRGLADVLGVNRDVLVQWYLAWLGREANWQEAPAKDLIGLLLTARSLRLEWDTRPAVHAAARQIVAHGLHRHLSPEATAPVSTEVFLDFCQAAIPFIEHTDRVELRGLLRQRLGDAPEFWSRQTWRQVMTRLRWQLGPQLGFTGREVTQWVRFWVAHSDNWMWVMLPSGPVPRGAGNFGEIVEILHAFPQDPDARAENSGAYRRIARRVLEDLEAGRALEANGWQLYHVSLTFESPEDRERLDQIIRDAPPAARFSAMRLRAWIHRNEGDLMQWRRHSHQMARNAELSADDRAIWLLARAHANGIHAGHHRLRLMDSSRWIRQAMATAESEPVRVVACLYMAEALAMSQLLPEAISMLSGMMEQLEDDDTRATIQARLARLERQLTR